MVDNRQDAMADIQDCFQMMMAAFTAYDEIVSREIAALERAATTGKPAAHHEPVKVIPVLFKNGTMLRLPPHLRDMLDHFPVSEIVPIISVAEKTGRNKHSLSSLFTGANWRTYWRYVMDKPQVGCYRLQYGWTELPAEPK